MASRGNSQVSPFAGGRERIVTALGADFSDVAGDPRIETRADRFIEFCHERCLVTPGAAKQQFKEHLGRARVYRSLALVEGTPEYRRIFEQGELLSKIAARTGDLAPPAVPSCIFAPLRRRESVRDDPECL